MDLDKIKNILSEEGFRPEVDEDGDLVFKYEGNVYFLEIDSDDDAFVKLVLLNFWEIESEAEKEAANILRHRRHACGPFTRSTELKLILKCVAAFILLAALFPTAGFAGEPTPEGACRGCYSPASVVEDRVLAAANFAIRTQQEALREKQKTDQTALELVSIVHAEEQVVAGMNYRLELKVTLDGEEKTAKAVVYEKPWGPVQYKLTSWTWLH